MGLQDIDEVERTSSSGTQGYPERFKTYGTHEMDESIETWFDEFESRFPEPIDCEFIEVSPEMSSTRGMAYWRQREGEEYYYIRLAEHAVEGREWRARQTLLHEMVHIYCFQNDWKNISDGSTTFKWLCGAVNASVNQVGTTSREWKQLMEPMIPTEDNLTDPSEPADDMGAIPPEEDPL